MPYVQSISDVLSSHLGWHRARLKFMARFTSAVLAMTTTNLRRIAPSAEGWRRSGVQLPAHVQRFLSEYDLDAVALGRLLVHLLPQGAPYEVVVDRTEWHFGETPVNILVMGIAHQGMALRNGLSRRMEHPFRRGQLRGRGADRRAGALPEGRGSRRR